MITYSPGICVPRNESSRRRMFHETFVLKKTWKKCFEKHSSLRTKVPGDESSRERKFHPMELSSLGTKVLRDESSIIP